MRPRPRHLWRSVRRRLPAVGALVAYLVAALGLPLPPVVAAGDAAFPCQGRLCGCQTAEDCARHCQCHAAAPSCPRCAAKAAARAEECPHCSGKDPNAPCRHGMTHPAAPRPLTLAAPGCRGEAASWVFTGAVPAVLPPVAVPAPTVTARRPVPADATAHSKSQPPPLPPPRTSPDA